MRRLWNRRTRRLLKLPVILIALTLAYSMLISTRRVEVSHHNATISNLPIEMNGIRVVQISDIHVSPLFRAGSMRRIVRMTNDCHPDLIVLTGDFVNYGSIKYLPKTVQKLRALKAPLGVFACLGNHDYWEGADEVRAVLEDNGVKVLMNENVKLGDRLYLAGLDDLMSGSPDLKQTLEGIPDNSAAILLSHNPTVLPRVRDHDLLVLSGHSHGGQIALPFLGPRRTIELPGLNAFTRYYESFGVKARHGRMDAVSTYRYPEGWYNDERAKMFVSRGIGFNLAIPIRLNCAPEIACFDLRAKADEIN